MLRFKNWVKLGKKRTMEGMRATDFDRVIREGLTEKVTFEQRPEGDKENLMCISGVVEKSMCIGPGAGVCLAYLRESKEANVANTDGARQIW